MRDAQTFLEGLRDSREVWYRGERVESVVDHGALGGAARHAAAEFDLALDPKHRPLQSLSTMKAGNTQRSGTCPETRAISDAGQA